MSELSECMKDDTMVQQARQYGHFEPEYFERVLYETMYQNGQLKYLEGERGTAWTLGQLITGSVAITFEVEQPQAVERDVYECLSITLSKVIGTTPGPLLEQFPDADREKIDQAVAAARQFFNAPPDCLVFQPEHYVFSVSYAPGDAEWKEEWDQPASGMSGAFGMGAMGFVYGDVLVTFRVLLRRLPARMN